MVVQIHPMKFNRLAFIVWLISCCLTATAQVSDPANNKKIVCRTGAVVSAHPLASEAGLRMLKIGGNAFDAAIATQLALAVVYPGAGNIGGGGFLLAHLKNGKNICLDYRERASAHAHRDMYLDSSGTPIPGLSQLGHLSCGVPGTVAGLFATLPYARLPFKTLIAPAIRLARDGFPVTAMQAFELNKAKGQFMRYNRKPVAFVKDSSWKAGDLLVQQELAATLQRIARHGAKEFYEGITAGLIVAEMKAANGIIDHKDLQQYSVAKRTVTGFNYKGYQVLSMPLPSSGGILLQQLMKMTATKDIAAMGFHTTASVQLMAEAERRAYADRAMFLGDADFVKVPVKTLTSDRYLQQRIAGYTPGKAGSSELTGAGDVKESEETTHISIVDKDGNAVAITTTLNDHFGSKTVVSGAGFLLNNEMDDFSIKEGYPNLYGVTGTAANAIAPNKRMLSSMTPTIVLKNKLPYIIVGSPGGATIPTTVFQTLLNLLDFKLSPEAAVNSPKFHHQWLPDRIDIEETFPSAVADSLTALGYLVKKRAPIGRTELIRITYHPVRQITAVADIRGDDAAAGY